MSSGRRDLIRMSETERRLFVEQQHTLIVGTTGRSGHPHLVPMWFAELDGRIVFWTYGTAQKAVNLRRDPRMSCLVEAGESYEQLRGVFMEGRGAVSEEPDQVRRVGEAIAQRYAGGHLDDAGRQAVHRSAAKRVAVTFECSRLVSWDHGKLGGGY